jgi:hypothetical protein
MLRECSGNTRWEKRMVKIDCGAQGLEHLHRLLAPCCAQMQTLLSATCPDLCEIVQWAGDQYNYHKKLLLTTEPCAETAFLHHINILFLKCVHLLQTLFPNS